MIESSAETENSKTERRIVVCSDGTWNKGGSSTPTNVWRTYLAVDHENQFKIHDDGVGSSGNRFFRYLGGATGFGISRNLEELIYQVSLVYQPDDKIYMFGFSRGAFTVRVLANIFCLFGVPKSKDRSPAQLAQLSREMLAAYKEQNHALANVREDSITVDEKTTENATVVSDVIYGTDAVASSNEDVRQQYPDLIAQCHPKSGGFDVEFVGVWDTVEALGVPFEPVKKLVNGVFKLRFPDNVPNPRIKHLYQAMALDEARHTFQVIPWYVPKERRQGQPEQVSGQVIEQVWFPGCHSHIGGGYEKDQLAFGALKWMLEKAEDAGLKLNTQICNSYYQQANAHGQLLDSRSGSQAFYRYYPRILSRSQPERDADFNPIGPLDEYNIHETVHQRLSHQTNGYAPIAIDVAKVNVVGNEGFQGTSYELGQSYQDQIGAILERYVPLRRLLYLVNLLLVAVFLFFTLWMSSSSMVDSFHASEKTPKFLRWLLKCVGTMEYPFTYLFETFLPAFIGGPIAKALKNYPGALFLFAGAAFVVRRFSHRIVVETQRNASIAWHSAVDAIIAKDTTQVCPNETITASSRQAIVERFQEQALRLGQKYGKLMDTLDGYIRLPRVLREASDKTWKVIIVLTVVLIAVFAGYMLQIFYGKFHRYERQAQRGFPAASLYQIPETEFQDGKLTLKRRFDLRSPRWPTGLYLEKGKKYHLAIEKIGTWSLNSKSTNDLAPPEVLRQVSTAKIVEIEDSKNHKFMAEVDGQLFLFIEKDWSGFYYNNSGEGEITIEALPDDAPLD